MGNIRLEDILQLLALGQGQDLLWSLFLYLVFFLALLTLLLMPDKNMVPTLLTAAVLMFAIIAKVSLASNDPILTRKSFGMMVINVGIGVLPFIVAGMVRVGTRRGTRATLPAFLGGLFGTAYFLMFLIFVQRV